MWYTSAEFGGFRDTVDVRLHVLPVFDIELEEIFIPPEDSLKLPLRKYLSQQNYVGEQEAEQKSIKFAPIVFSDNIAVRMIDGDFWSSSVTITAPIG